MNVHLVSMSQPIIVDDGKRLTAEEMIAYTARVSNPGNQMNTETAPQLLRYLVKHKHWSPFEMVSMCVCIKTSRAIAAQILRHRSFSFQEFSQRYAKAGEMEEVELRVAGADNRQSSVAVIVDPALNSDVEWALRSSWDTYDKLCAEGVATETARMVLPLCTQTTMYMHGTIRSWIHYLQQRMDEHTQKEHRLIALEIGAILMSHFPTVYEAVFGHMETEI